MKLAYRFLRALYRWALRQPVQWLRWLGKASVRLGPAVGFYSALEQPGDAVIVQARQEERPVKPDCLRIRCGFTQHRRQPWPIFWQRISPARLVGESLAVMNDRKQLMIESVYGPVYGPDDPSFNYHYLPPPTHLSGNWTSTLSRWFPASSTNYYHWLMDALPRLALLDKFPADTGILTSRSLNSFQRETLEILGLAGRCRPTPETHLVLENYYYSSFTAFTGCDNPYALQFLRDKFLGAAAEMTHRPEKIYISRLGSNRAALNEEELVAILESKGWAIIRTEKYTFREQVALFSSAKAVCAIHGAGLTNLLWCPKGCQVLEICASNFLNGCYESIAAYLDLDYRYMVFDGDFRCRVKVDLKSFGAAIEAME